jgi:hypothetical protein
MERNRAATTPRTISSTVAIVQDGDVCNTVPRSRPFGGRPPRRGSRVPSANPSRAARRGGKKYTARMRAFPRGRRAVDRDPRRAIAIGASSQPTRIAATVAPV